MARRYRQIVMEPCPLSRRHDTVRLDAILARLEPVEPPLEAMRLGPGELAAGHPGVDAALRVRLASIDPRCVNASPCAAVLVSIPIAISAPAVGTQRFVVMALPPSPQVQLPRIGRRDPDASSPDTPAAGVSARVMAAAST